LDNRRYVLRSRPVHLAGPENFELERGPIPEPQDGQALVAIEMAALSAWQGMRTKDFKNFIRPFDIGELIDCDDFARVVESRCDQLPVGTAVVGRLGWQDYALVAPGDVSVATSAYTAEEWLTVLSSPGQTPYLAFSQKARLIPGGTLVVTSAAGAVGGYAVQLGLLGGMRVVGIAGGRRKVAFVRDTLGAHAAVDYQSEDFEDALAAACPEGVDLFFDTVGGPTGDCVLALLAKHAHVLLVGRVAANNSPDPEQDPVNMRHVWSQEATVHAFSRYAYKDLYAQTIDRLGALLRAERLNMHNNMIHGFEQTPTALNAMLTGHYIGKVLVRYADKDGVRI
jgi:hypothetical protein